VSTWGDLTETEHTGRVEESAQPDAQPTPSVIKGALLANTLFVFLLFFIPVWIHACLIAISWSWNLIG